MTTTRPALSFRLAAPLLAAVFALPAIGFSAAAEASKAGGPPPSTFRTAQVSRGDLTVTISATGTLEPEETIDVGAQVAGTIVRLGDDPHQTGKRIDFGSQVEPGTLLAQIDDTLYVSQVEQARATCTRAEAELMQERIKLELAGAQWKRAQELFKLRTITESDLDVAKLTHKLAQASLPIAEAAVALSQVGLKQAQTNLDYTRIRSPVKGVVIDRRVNVGQTVVASLNAPSLFLIAKDLKKLQVWVSVNEADIGRIRAGQTARFTVDAYRDKVFQGKVQQVRLNATLTKNVVTYTVVVSADNSDEKLLPYLTANVQFEVETRQGVLLVPNAALRWRPRPEQIVPDARPSALPPAKPLRVPHVCVREGQRVRPIEVQVGATDGMRTEVAASNLREGMEVVIGENVVPSGSDSSNPFAPKFFKSGDSKAALEQKVADMGDLVIFSGAASSSGISFGVGSQLTLTPQDAEEIGRQCPAVRDVAPLVRVRSPVVYQNRNWSPMTLYGTTPAYLAARNWENLDEGDAFTDKDVLNHSKVCLIGATLKRELFQNDSPLGKDIRIKNVSFRVIGVLSGKGDNIMGLDQDDIVLAPWTTIKQFVSSDGPSSAKPATSPGTASSASLPNSLSPAAATPESPPTVRLTNVDSILVKAVSAQECAQAIDQITQVLRATHHLQPGQPDDFNIRDLGEIRKALGLPRN